MTDQELIELERWTERIMKRARAEGLDFYDMRFEVCPPDVIYAFGAYGMPTRFSHWSFGKAFHRLKTEYDYNLSRIYELVVNSDPCYAFLLDGNSLLQNKLVIAHVLGHSDFFKHNWRFRGTSRFMMENMAAHAERIARYEFRYGMERVEQLLDAALALAEQVDPHPVGPPSAQDEDDAGEQERGRPARPSTPYDDLWALDERLEAARASASPRAEAPAGAKEGRRAGFSPREPAGGDRPGGAARPARKWPPRPEKDVLGFILRHSDYLDAWERDVLAMVREEALYFWPQIETKIMNEGWASYWHLRLMRDEELGEEDALEFARMHAGVIQPHPLHLNPYLLGLKIFESIEARWDHPSEEDRRRLGLTGGQGREKIFEVRELETDASFVRSYLSRKVVEDLKLFTFVHQGDEWQVESVDWEHVRDALAAKLANGGIPSIWVEEADYRGAGELLLRHQWDGQVLDLEHLEKTLPHVHRLWGRPVHLLTVVDGKETIFSFDGEQHRRSSP
ncbi:SpoVR family protein [Carboxydochorda subterranea]|uniref:SpoVR family protein n=1 Tax=Carboxydichorda subterranea TaxID=3109565 RepID=A0ABZ1BZ33_9FIRM|nr:SpoVR family protein [Limnochorda sp. L945t]WRP17761.1 SpoVR family protein [Limnochorda sp. L945t]